jgi:type IV secretion system protein VirB10
VLTQDPLDPFVECTSGLVGREGLSITLKLGPATNNDNAIVTAPRNLNIHRRSRYGPGFPVRVIVNRDLVLAPYRS